MKNTMLSKINLIHLQSASNHITKVRADVFSSLETQLLESTKHVLGAARSPECRSKIDQTEALLYALDTVGSQLVHLVAPAPKSK